MIPIESVVSKPQAQACDDAGVFGRLVLCAAQVGRAAERTLMDDADVGRKPARELVTQAQAGFERAQPGANAAARIVLPVDVRFDPLLQAELDTTLEAVE